MNAETLTQQLKAIKEDSCEPGVPYGILTHQPRDDWAKSYCELMKSPESVACVEEIQKSLFTVSLDRNVCSSKDEMYNTISHQLMHGGSRSDNSANRWMDKTIQVGVRFGDYWKTAVIYLPSVSTC